MIAVDASALCSIAFDEPEAERCRAVMMRGMALIISAVTVSEALVVGDRRGEGRPMRRLIRELDFEVVPATRETAFAVADIYTRWGKGVHPAGLNWGDCFSYLLASERGCPLLYVGDDFSRTDIRSALDPIPAPRPS